MLTLGTAVRLLTPYIGAGIDPVDRINLVIQRYLDSNDCVGALELVTFTVTADANGQGFITLPTRYEAIRGAVTTTIADSLCRFPLEIRNDRFEYAPGNLGMITGSDPMRGIIPITQAEGDTTRQFKVPVCPTEGSVAYFSCVCKRAFLFQEDDTDVIAVQNLGALKMGLKALDKEDAEDYLRAEQAWAKGETLLARQSDNVTGSEALGKVQMEDDWGLGDLGQETSSWYGWGWGGAGNW